MYDFMTIDFETASSENYSACAIGLAFVKNLEVVHTKSYLIQPPTLIFNQKNIEIHGITANDVKDKPKFPEIWDEIKSDFDGNSLIIAHNARFDMSVLKCCLDFYEIDHPNFDFTDSIPISTKICTSEVPRTLKSRAEFFGIDMGTHHEAESDAITCAKIVIESVNKSRQKSLQSFMNVRAIETWAFSELKASKSLGKPLYARIDYAVLNEIAATSANTDNFFYGKLVVLTGTLKTLDRKIAMQRLMDVGAIIKNGVTKQTNFLIVGEQDKTVVGDDGLSGKEEKAYALIEQGIPIKIFNEKEFLVHLYS